ncbi:CMP-N,N'-diacetyllegionaminic acid synthase [Poriferisphaera corsica]|uniref:CMP-N,N'-diacetyllegionaminic acid synthase n=1 Tax=Poriferisphaera corsica TaxID=2528020 RepID=A0A517YYX8_9BACT|nr:acylneuraminate cytidylyltransferase family protein [Poriferisphaera corsica]QDU35431.1 CMP-N,N'-diacetyllegionaminic acid synthase [Poriferisphaera corsica]
MNTLAIILARAGSQGLPNKNGLILAGKPMLQYTFDHALASTSITHTILSTDGPHLAQIAKHNNIPTILRPDDLATSTATVDAAARHALTEYEKQTSLTFGCIAILYGNVPVRPHDLTDRAINKLTETNCDSVQSVYPVEKNHPYWMKRVDDDSRLLMYQDNNIYRRQDLPPVYMLDGGVIALTRQSLQTTSPDQPHAFLGSDRRAIITQPHDVVDIDTAIDLKIAEAILSDQRQSI